VLSGQETIRFATAYEHDGTTLTAMPSNIRHAAQVKPIYEDLPGWKEDIDHVRDFDSLPGQARDYIRRIEEYTGIPAQIVSVGPDREETLLLSNPFDTAQ
jgi:adenylosuccinate synthase